MSHSTLPATTGAHAVRNNVRVTGSDGPTLVFAHGFGADQRMWDRVAPAFAEGHRVVLFDHVGAGGSDLDAYSTRKYRSLRGYADDLLEVLEELEELGTGPVHLVGHSAGAMIGLLASIQRPELFASLVLLGASARYLDDDGYRGGFSRSEIDQLLEAMETNYLGWAYATAPVVMRNPERPELAEELAQSFARTQSRIAVEFARAIFLSDHRADLLRVSVPSLVVQTSDDPMVPSGAGSHLHAAIPGSTLVELTATGHFPHVSGPEETTRVIRRHLDDLAAPGHGG